MIYLFLADGFEEIEALATVDILRRAGQTVQTVGVTGKEVTGSHGICVKADCLLSDVHASEATMVILPGGLPGTTHLDESEAVRSAVQACADRGGWVCAICAAPSVLGHMGLLNGKKATCYPGYEKDLHGAVPTGLPVCMDGKCITANGAGSAVRFALKLVEVLCGKEKADAIAAAMQC